MPRIAEDVMYQSNVKNEIFHFFEKLCKYNISTSQNAYDMWNENYPLFSFYCGMRVNFHTIENPDIRIIATPHQIQFFSQLLKTNNALMIKEFLDNSTPEFRELLTEGNISTEVVIPIFLNLVGVQTCFKYTWMLWQGTPVLKSLFKGEDIFDSQGKKINDSNQILRAVQHALIYQHKPIQTEMTGFPHVQQLITNLKPDELTRFFDRVFSKCSITAFQRLRDLFKFYSNKKEIYDIALFFENKRLRRNKKLPKDAVEIVDSTKESDLNNSTVPLVAFGSQGKKFKSRATALSETLNNKLKNNDNAPEGNATKKLRVNNNPIKRGSITISESTDERYLLSSVNTLYSPSQSPGFFNSKQRHFDRPEVFTDEKNTSDSAFKSSDFFNSEPDHLNNNEVPPGRNTLVFSFNSANDFNSQQDSLNHDEVYTDYKAPYDSSFKSSDFFNSEPDNYTSKDNSYTEKNGTYSSSTNPGFFTLNGADFYIDEFNQSYDFNTF